VRKQGAPLQIDAIGLGVLLLIFDYAMNKPNYLYGIIGLLAGLIVGYIGTSYINQTNRPAATAGDTAATSTALPPDRPAPHPLRQR
jgi:hypothetical protein